MEGNLPFLFYPPPPQAGREIIIREFFKVFQPPPPLQTREFLPFFQDFRNTLINDCTLINYELMSQVRLFFMMSSLTKYKLYTKHIFNKSFETMIRGGGAFGFSLIYDLYCFPYFFLGKEKGNIVLDPPSPDSNSLLFFKFYQGFGGTPSPPVWQISFHMNFFFFEGIPQLIFCKLEIDLEEFHMGIYHLKCSLNQSDIKCPIAIVT